MRRSLILLIHHLAMVFIRSSAYVRILLNDHKESVSSRIANRSHNYMRLCCSSKEATDINSGISYSKKLARVRAAFSLEIPDQFV